MKISEVNKFDHIVFREVLRLLPQLSSDILLPSEEYFRKILRSENTHLFIAELDNKQVIGMMSICTYAIPTGIKCWVEDVVVDESQRGRGYGKELIRFAVKFARTTGAKSIELTSRPSRVAANELYKESGFEQRETNVYRYNFNPQTPHGGLNNTELH